MQRVVSRIFSDGLTRSVHPFHVSMEGLENVVLFRDEEDYDVMVKTMAVCAWRCNVLIVIYAVVSNHGHAGILAESQEAADSFGEEIKRIYAMWFSRKYGERKTLHGRSVIAIWLDNDWYVRNALAYIPRNALDNGCDIWTYPWSGIGAMFTNDPHRGAVRRVADLSKRDRERVLHTGVDLTATSWELDASDRLLPASFCDRSYLEQAFGGDRTYFLRVVTSQNTAEMKQKLLDNPRRRVRDGELYKIVSECCQRWFNAPVAGLSLDRKSRLLPYVYRTHRTTVSQLARVFGLDRETVARLLQKRSPVPESEGPDTG